MNNFLIILAVVGGIESIFNIGTKMYRFFKDRINKNRADKKNKRKKKKNTRFK